MWRVSVMVALFVLAIICEVVYVAGLTCKNKDGNDVDWYYVYKLPIIPENANPFIKQGTAFYYLDNSQQTFQLSSTSMEDTSQPVAKTLQQIYSPPHPVPVAYAMYNDQPPDENHKQTWGHTKGVVAFDHEKGFWMIHSVPRFPLKQGPYQWADNGRTNGQSILCVSLKSSEMDKIANQMMYTYPYVYSSSLPLNLQQIGQTFKNVIEGNYDEISNGTSAVELHSLNGQVFVHFAKHNCFVQDLYKWVANDIKGHVYAETWRRKNPRLHSVCSGTYHVYNIDEVSFSNTVKFSYTKDHSKWAISDNSKQVICVGDINREISQFTRGGGTLCAHLPNVWHQYTSIRSKFEDCP